MVLEPILCPICGSSDVVKHGQSGESNATNVATPNVLALLLFATINIVGTYQR